MTEENNKPENANLGDDKRVLINLQYVKDLSFENPGSPASLGNKGERPKIDINVDVNASALEGDAYEVVLSITAKAKREDETMFVTELAYGGVFTLKNLSEEEREPALLIFCPNLLFPFARRIIADATRDGGFLPLMLDPIDFARLYAARRQQQEQGAA